MTALVQCVTTAVMASFMLAVILIYVVIYTVVATPIGWVGLILLAVLYGCAS